MLLGLYLLFLVTYSIKPHINARGQRIGLLDTWFYSPKYEEAAAIPVALAIAWLGYALLSERRARASEPASSTGSPQLRRTAAE